MEPTKQREVVMLAKMKLGTRIALGCGTVVVLAAATGLGGAGKISSNWKTPCTSMPAGAPSTWK